MKDSCIVVVHNNTHLISILNVDKTMNDFFQGIALSEFLQHEKLPQSQWLCLVHVDFSDQTASFLQAVSLNNKAQITTAAPQGKPHILSTIGYVEDGPFINVNLKSTYPTWQLHSDIILINTELIVQIPSAFYKDFKLNYWLSSIAKIVREQGVFCTQMRVQKANFHEEEKIPVVDYYKFVKQHYKTRWTFLLLLCHIWYERRFPLYAFAKAQCSKRRHLNIDIASLQQSMLGHDIDDLDYDVIIPTMGRSTYLKDVLNDLSKQAYLPARVIIIEQHPVNNAPTALSYLTTENWPFEIIHKLIYRTGACNARNLGLSLTAASWVLLFDDDIRIQPDFSNEIAVALDKTGAKAMTFACLQKNETETMQAFKQWESFGSGCSIVHKEVVEKCVFDMALEHGYGEDVDYGMQIRNAGYDVIYAPQIQIVHLKAPVGGFRKPHIFPWVSDAVQPKPSPQIMYHRTKNYSKEQLLGYKMVLFFKTFGALGTKTPWGHIRAFNKSWERSLFWATKL